MRLYYQDLERPTRLVSSSRLLLLELHWGKWDIQFLCVLFTFANTAVRPPLIYIKHNMTLSVLPYGYESQPPFRCHHCVIRSTEYLNWHSRLSCTTSQKMLYNWKNDACVMHCCGHSARPVSVYLLRLAPNGKWKMWTITPITDAKYFKPEGQTWVLYVNLSLHTAQDYCRSQTERQRLDGYMDWSAIVAAYMIFSARIAPCMLWQFSNVQDPLLIDNPTRSQCTMSIGLESWF